MEASENVPAGSGKGIGYYVSLLWRKKLIIIAAAILGGVIGSGVAISLPETYRSSATIIIEDAEIPPELIGTTITSFAERRLEVIHQRIMTTQNLADVILKFNLYQDIRTKEPMIAAVEKLRAQINLQKGIQRLTDPRSGRPINNLISFNLVFFHEDPRTARDVTAELARLYLEANARARRIQSTEVAAFLGTEAERIAKKVTDLESRLTKFRQDNPGFAVGQSGMLLDFITRTQEKIRQVDSQLQDLNNRELLLQRELEIAKLPTANQDPGLLSPAQIQAEYDRVTQIYGPDHPDVIRLRRLLDNAESASSGGANLRLDTAARDPVSIRVQAQLDNLRSERANLRREKKAIEEEIEALERKSLEFPLLDQQYLALQRDYENAKYQYDQTKQKQLVAEQANVLEKSRKGERFSLLEPPMVPRDPSSPNRPIIAIAGLGAGLGLTLGLIFLLDLMDQRIHTVQQLRAVIGADPIIMVPDLRDETQPEELDKKTLYQRVTGGIGSALHAVKRQTGLFFGQAASSMRRPAVSRRRPPRRLRPKSARY